MIRRVSTPTPDNHGRDTRYWFCPSLPGDGSEVGIIRPFDYVLGKHWSTWRKSALGSVCESNSQADKVVLEDKKPLPPASPSVPGAQLMTNATPVCNVTHGDVAGGVLNPRWHYLNSVCWCDISMSLQHLMLVKVKDALKQRGTFCLHCYCSFTSKRALRSGSSVLVQLLFWLTWWPERATLLLCSNRVHFCCVLTWFGFHCPTKIKELLTYVLCECECEMWTGLVTSWTQLSLWFLLLSKITTFSSSRMEWLWFWL